MKYRWFHSLPSNKLDMKIVKEFEASQSVEEQIGSTLLKYFSPQNFFKTTLHRNNAPLVVSKRMSTISHNPYNVHQITAVSIFKLDLSGSF